MKKLFTILALVLAVLTVIFAVLPLSNLAIFPGIPALIFGIAAYFLSKKTGEIKKSIQFSILLTALALILATYKAAFTKTEVANTETLEATETKLEEESIEELEGLELDDIEIDDSELEGVEIDMEE
ncbi:FUSC family protein [Tamlana sp. I1]|uniref:FUSC family protein n=1 Tax=Tamlana sp. I1 TaxID=2762061 RepID=UPI001890B125|nr:FUSC family protein [Tamlana sp. I1]